ncbi:signal peptidase I [Candidatus Aerophobetes bacterium]|nr:signal peptidase I [Candidatus Aerophobetes bacterium]
MKKKIISTLKETVETIVIAFVLAFFIRTFVAESFWIPTGSMKPTLHIKDRIMAYKFCYGLKNVDRGDILVFKYPLNPKQNFVKRVIGLPGDEILIKDKKLYVNGKLINEPYVIHEDDYLRGFPRDEYGPVKVPLDSVFVMGDNRDNSADSRYWGFVPQQNLVGEAFLLYWPLWRAKIIKRPQVWKKEEELLKEKS